MKQVFKLAATAAICFAGAGCSMDQKSLASTPASAPMAQAASNELGGHPDLNGIWQTMNSANWNLEPHSAATNRSGAAEEALGAIGGIPAGVGVVKGGEIPYLPEAKAIRDERAANAPEGDPEAACYLPGIPRATYIGLPFQIIQGEKGDILMAYEYAAANRVVYMQDVGIPPIDTWMGTSYGSWDGDTLVVVTLAQNGETWLDRAGNFLSPSATVTERFTPNGPDHLDYEVTIADPAVFSEAWTMSMPLYRRMEKNAQLLEYKCVPFAEVHLYGDLRPENLGKD